MTDLLKLGAMTLSQGLKEKKFTATELTQAYLDQMDRKKELNIYCLEMPEVALTCAKKSDQLLASGQGRALEGLPLAIKDAFCMKNVRTTAGSKILENFISPYESTITAKLLDQGTVPLGKANTDEFFMGSATTPVFFGPTFNPWNKEYTPGGSSGGPAAAVASASTLWSIGTDTGGSIRQPAAFCGIVGLKPTYGRCSRWGIVALSSSFDQAGPLARTVTDCALLFQSMAGYDPKDSTSTQLPVPDCVKATAQSVKGKKIGVQKEWYESSHIDEDMRAMWENSLDIFRQEGAEIVFVSLPYARYALPVYYIIMCAEAASNLARYDGVRYGLRVEDRSLEGMYKRTRGQGFGPEARRRICLGTHILSQGYYEAYYKKAKKIRQLLAMDYKKAFEQVDVLLNPTTPTPAFRFDDSPKDPISMYWNDILTVPVNVGDVCALSVPGGMSSKGLPLGIQITGPRFGEEKLFCHGAVIERAVSMPDLPF